MRTTEARASARGLLRTFVESQPKVEQAIVTRRNGGRYIVAWPWRPVLRTAVRATITSGVAVADPVLDSDFSAGQMVIKIREGRLLVVPFGRELEFRLVLSDDCDLRELWPYVTSLINSVEKIQGLM